MNSIFKLLLSVFLAVMVFQSPLVSAPNQNHTLLEKCLKKIQQLPEARQLMEEIRKDGDIHFNLSNNSLSQQFGAFWDVDNRTICVNPNWHESEGQLIASIIFEMHNAAATPELDRLDRMAVEGRIGKEEYVKSVEYVEYKNSKKASAIAEKGIQIGLFPETSRLMTYSNFDEHYFYQIKGGHSAWIARTYDQLTQR